MIKEDICLSDSCGESAGSSTNVPILDDVNCLEILRISNKYGDEIPQRCFEV